jgi:hypothetical protein
MVGLAAVLKHTPLDVITEPSGADTDPVTVTDDSVIPDKVTSVNTGATFAEPAAGSSDEHPWIIAIQTDAKKIVLTLKFMILFIGFDKYIGIEEIIKKILLLTKRWCFGG